MGKNVVKKNKHPEPSIQQIVIIKKFLPGMTHYIILKNILENYGDNNTEDSDSKQCFSRI